MRRPALVDTARHLAARGGAGVVDAGVALVLLAVELAVLASASGEGSPVLALAACVIQAGAVAVRRRMPTLSALSALAGMVVFVAVTNDAILASPPVAVMLTSYTLGRHGAPRHHSRQIVLVGGLGLAATGYVSALIDNSRGDLVSSWLVAVVAPLAVGVLLARRSRLSQRLADAVEQLRAEQDLNAAQATAEERNRVARDLHDVVAHCVSVMVVQAGAARLVVASSPADTDRALTVIGDCGRSAMVDLRRIVGVLRRTDDPDFSRGVGLGDLGLLTARIQASGVPTQLRISGSAKLPPALDGVAFRVVQEALTNVVKHAGSGATASVDVHIDAEALSVEVCNTRGWVTPRSTTSGHGLMGMQERVQACGGVLRVGPRPQGGYRVRARIPLPPFDPPAASLRSARRAPWPSHLMSPRVASALIVAFWLVVMESEVATSSARRGPWLLNAAAVAVMAVAAGWRRRSPLLVLAVVGGLAVALSSGLTSLDRSTFTGLYCLAVPLFAVGAWEPRARATAGLGLWAAGAGAVALTYHGSAGGFAGALVVGIVVWTAGRLWRAQRLLNAHLAETTKQLAAQGDQRARLAVVNERIRIARDLHGSVAHGVITMVVQADVARTLLAHQPGNVEAAIREIEQTGRNALSQLRSILGVLRSSTGSSTATELGPGLHVPAPLLGDRATPLAEQVLT